MKTLFATSQVARIIDGENEKNHDNSSNNSRYCFGAIKNDRKVITISNAPSGSIVDIFINNTINMQSSFTDPRSDNVVDKNLNACFFS